MLAAGKAIRRALALALCCATALGPSAATPAAAPIEQGWSANPEERFLLDVKLRQLRLGDGVRAYQTPSGACLLLGDFLTTIDVPMRIDLSAKKASGWAFKEDHRIEIDLERQSVRYGDNSEALAPNTVREVPDGWCVDSAALTRWFGIGVKPVMSGATLILESEAKLPVELAIERRQRAARLKPAKFDLDTLPQVRLPYRMWRAPALDFVVSAGIAYRASDGLRVDRQSSLYAAGEIARLSYDARLSTNDKGVPSALRMRAYRSDPDAGLLGPLKATHFGFGDVPGFDSSMIAASQSGRGAIVTNRPLFNPSAFGRTRFEGDLPAGWEAEIYRNGELLAFATPNDSGRYLFEDVELHYGENRISIVLYGPQGQIRNREELVNVGQDNVPAGKTWYWAGINQPGRDLVAFRDSPGALTQPEVQATVSVEHGLDERTSVGALARAMLINDERVTFVEGSVRRSIGPALTELAFAADSGGGKAVRAQALTRIGSVNARAEARIAENFLTAGGRRETRKDFKLSVNAPVKIGRSVIPASADLRLTEQGDGTSQLEAAARLSTRIDRFNLATDVRYRRQYSVHGPSPPGAFDLSVMGSGRVGDVRVRGFASAEVAPQPRFRSAELSAYWSASDTVDWEGAIAWDAGPKRARARVTHVRRFESMALALTGEAATDGSVAVGFNVNFSLDVNHGFDLSRQPLAGAGSIHARVYRDLNDNGVREESEPLEEGALITAGTRVVERPTNAKGAVLVGGLPTFTPLTVGIDTTSLGDPMLVPRKALQVVVPRPGVPATVEIGLVGAGDIEGAIVKSGGIGFEGLALELVDASGKTAASTRTDFDGFFLFERVPYGSYTLRVGADSAAAAHVARDLGVTVSVSPDDSVARLGTIQVDPLPQIASSE